MKDLYFVANWKANKTEEEALEWLKMFKEHLPSLKGQFEHKEVIICPSYPILSTAYKYIGENDLPITLGAQDVSQFGRGPYTGEVPVSLIYKYVRYVIIGHSERRTNFNESDALLAKKVSSASSSVTPIFCVQDANTAIPEGIFIVAYEPVFAIGTGNPDTPENAEKVARIIKSNNKNIRYVLYGGSVTPENIRSFISMSHIDGVLVGGASLDPQSFLALLSQC